MKNPSNTCATALRVGSFVNFDGAPARVLFSAPHEVTLVLTNDTIVHLNDARYVPRRNTVVGIRDRYLSLAVDHGGGNRRVMQTRMSRDLLHVVTDHYQHYVFPLRTYRPRSNSYLRSDYARLVRVDADNETV